MNGCLDLVAAIVVAHPNHAIASLFSEVEHTDDVSAAQVHLNTRKKRSADADIADPGLLQKALAASVYSPDCYLEVGSCTRLTTAVDAVDDSHVSFFNRIAIPERRKDYALDLLSEHSPASFRFGTLPN
jgi:hypothetical protein